MTKPPRKSAKSKSKSASKKPRPLPPFPLNTEAVMRGIQKAMEGKTFENVEEANAYLATLTVPGLLDSSADEETSSPQWQAQELAFDAMEAATAEQARELAQRALALDPDCVDALVVMAGLDAKTEREAIAGLKNAVAAGERALGAEFFQQNKGDFWRILETRPYMRARAQLAELLRAAGSGVQAMEHYEGLLELNPNDNQGVRYPLLGCYLAHGRLEKAEDLLHKYKGDAMATFDWGRVLERFLAGDRPGAKAALKIARKGNRFVEAFFAGQFRMPEEMPDSYALGSQEEAMICFDHLSAAWVKDHRAMFWVMEQIFGPPASKPWA